MTGEVCERLNRKWYCIELSKEYLKGALGRFKGNLAYKEVVNDQFSKNKLVNSGFEIPYYVVPQPSYLWEQTEEELLPKDGGKEYHGNRHVNSLPLQIIAKD